MTKKSTKRALLFSALSLLLCVSMLIGTTFAWFTDSVTSGSNIIKSGNLDVEMYWADGDEDPSSAAWEDASEVAIFDYDLWEPGYIDAKHIKIANIGSLAFSYKLRVVANGIVSKLGDVIDVYYFDTATQLTRETVANGTKLGTLTEILGTNKNLSNTVCGDLLSKQEKMVTIAFKMQESAGNEYQNLSIGSNFSVELMAVQHTYEKDSFNEKYDENSLSATVPPALVRELDDKTISATLGIGGSAKEITLDTAYQFEPTQSYEELLESEYKYYIADFLVSADKDVPADSIALAGYYDAWCQYNNDNWVAMVNSGTPITAGTELALVELLNFTVHYKDICYYGNDGIGFLCGAADLTGENAGTTITVKLCLFETTADPNGSSASYEKVEGAEPIVIGEFRYTFPVKELIVDSVKTYDELKNALAAGEKKIYIDGVIELAGSLNATDVTFIGIGENSGINFNGHNIGGSSTITYENLALTTISLPEEGNGERYGWYGGIDYNGHSVANYTKCSLTGVFTTYSKTVNATDCTFNYYLQDGEEFYGLFLYGSGVVNATDCTFMYGDRAIKIYSDGAADFELNIEGGKFVATEDYTVNKPLINIDSTYFKSAKITVKGVTVDSKLATAGNHNAAGNSKVTVSWN